MNWPLGLTNPFPIYPHACRCTAGGRSYVSEIKHAPGPWRYGLNEYNDQSQKYEIAEKPFDYVGPGYYENPSIYDANGEEVVGCDEYHVFSTPANKALLCAAPELLEALESVVSDLFYQVASHHDEKTAYNYPSMVAARAAISRAKGKPLNPA